jgi:hypothetical protein
MKKMLTASLVLLLLSVFSGSALAANPVAVKATTMGGTHVAQCARMMEQGISSIATGTHICEK